MPLIKIDLSAIKSFVLALTSVVVWWTSPRLLADPNSETILRRRIADLQRRVTQDPQDFLSETALFTSYAHQSRRTGDLRYLGDAKHRLDRILSEVPDYLPAISARASLAVTMHDFALVPELASRATNMQRMRDASQVTPLLTMAADANFELGSYVLACERYTALLAENRSEPRYLTRVSRCRELQGSHDQALALLNDSVESARANRTLESIDVAWFFVNRGAFHFRHGRFLEASRDYQEALARDPSWWVPLIHQGELAGAQRRFADAERILEQAYTASSKRPEVAHALGDLLSLQGEAEKAKSWLDTAEGAFTEAERLGFIYYRHHLAHFYLDSRPEINRAISLAEADLKSRASLDAYDTLAWALYKKGEFDRAQQAIDAALQHGRYSAHVVYHAAMIYGALGQSKRSKELLQAAAKLNPAFMQFHIHR